MIYLLRHGRAVGDAPGGDDARWLTAFGRDEVRRVGAALAARNVAIDCIVSSPLVRAVQTAELVAAALGHAGPIEALPALRPEGYAQAAVDEVALLGAEVLVVGHEPLVSTAAGMLCNAGRPFSTAELRAIDGDRLAFILSP